MATPSPTDTKNELLEAAERLFAERGIARSSLRAITREAGANVASVNYHFGSKEGLVKAVLARRLEPLNLERLALLDRCLESAKGDPDLECVLRALVEPALQMMRDRETGHKYFAQIMGRAIADPEERVRTILLDEFREVKERFTAVLAGLLPHLSKEELFWRFHFMIGAMAHTAAGSFFVARHAGGIVDPADVEGISHKLVGFLAAAMRAPATRSRRKKKGKK
ncbi:MAG: TetR/AcrR family transcriptional regulator [Thermoanaerobaculia bacterium]